MCIHVIGELALYGTSVADGFPAKAWKRPGSSVLSDVNEDKSDVGQRRFGSSAALAVTP